MSDFKLPSYSKKLIILFVVVALVSTVVIAAAAYTITSPSSDLLTVNPEPSPTQPPQTVTLSKVTLSSYNVTVKQPVTASTTISDLTIINATVKFYASDGTFMGSSNTNLLGIACLTFNISSPWSGRIYATTER